MKRPTGAAFVTLPGAENPIAGGEPFVEIAIFAQDDALV